MTHCLFPLFHQNRTTELVISQLPNRMKTPGSCDTPPAAVFRQTISQMSGLQPLKTFYGHAGARCKGFNTVKYRYKSAEIRSLRIYCAVPQAAAYIRAVEYTGRFAASP